MSDINKETTVDTGTLVSDRYRLPPVKNGSMIDKSQPLNTIGGDSITLVHNDDIRSLYAEDGSSIIDETTDKHGIVCEMCEIPRFTGSCDGCGIYQYCSGQFSDNNQFEIFGIRRINNGISTESSDVKSDS